MVSDDWLEIDRVLQQFSEYSQGAPLNLAVARKIRELYDLYEFSPAGYLKLDKNGRIRSANLTAAFMLKTYRSELIGKSFYPFVIRKYRDELYLHLRNLFKEKKPQTCQLQIKGPNNMAHWVRLDSLNDHDTRKQPQSRTTMLDINEQKRAHEAEKLARMMLDAKVVELEQKIQELDQFAYSASHDLKAPLRAIQNYSHFLFEDLFESLSGEQKKYLEGLKVAAGQGQKLIDDLLAYSRISRTKIKAEKIDIPAMINEVKSFLDLSSDIDLSVQSKWPLLETDHMLLSQILKNLISNAVKFNPSTTKRVDIGWKQANTNGYIEIFVRDNGIGFDPQYQKQIFDIFKRLHTNKDYEGTGIGLAIVKKAAFELGGMVRVESAAGKGSTFYVSLPKSKLKESVNGIVRKDDF